ncbi:hypothetical protein CBR_g5623 [Chara braunii]|uniref:GST C-terminal domain-containing protein n=1 Tax=Chara braunii TaxID=69332 RepID=A0A388JRN5_CHABU|nr:hypothetical protein CBR_g5623 [Chara braunii]|eukprot:GBG60448.1 hypothetical protein CBR_g5623 [Chara braunii]
MLIHDFNDLASEDSPDLAPAALQKQIDEINGWVTPDINSGVYRCGFATSQDIYNEACTKLYAALDRVEKILAKQRFLVGNTFTEADIRLFVSLIRFDEVYVVLYKTNKKLLREYLNILGYMKDVYQIPKMALAVDMYHIKKFYFMSQLSLNPHGIIPLGTEINYSGPHDRATRFR